MPRQISITVLLALLVVGCGQAAVTDDVIPDPTVTITRQPQESEPASTPALATPSATQEETKVRESSGVGQPDADVEFVRAVQDADGTWTFHVTVRHPDTGWEDYADGWDVVTDDGTVLKPDPNSPYTRLLLHPHETEQPFTRSQGRISIPDGVTQVTVRAHDLVDGFGGQEVRVDVTVASGNGFEVER